MNNIYVKDNGTILSFTINDERGVVDLTSANVNVTLRKGRSIIIKEASIIDLENGKCQIILSDSDIEIEGQYACQLTVKFLNGYQFSSNINHISVSPLIV